MIPTQPTDGEALDQGAGGTPAQGAQDPGQTQGQTPGGSSPPGDSASQAPGSDEEHFVPLETHIRERQRHAEQRAALEAENRELRAFRETTQPVLQQASQWWETQYPALQSQAANAARYEAELAEQRALNEHLRRLAAQGSVPEGAEADFLERRRLIAAAERSERAVSDLPRLVQQTFAQSFQALQTQHSQTQAQAAAEAKRQADDKKAQDELAALAAADPRVAYVANAVLAEVRAGGYARPVKEIAEGIVGPMPVIRRPASRPSPTPSQAAAAVAAQNRGEPSPPPPTAGRGGATPPAADPTANMGLRRAVQWHRDNPGQAS